MLVLSAREGETIEVGETKVRILRIAPGKVQIGFEAPQSVKILRSKVIEKRMKEHGEQDEA